MKEQLKIPNLGESVQEATIGKLLKTPGDIVRADDELVEIETEKLNQVLYAPANGKVSFLVKSGDRVPVGAVIAEVEVVAQGNVEKKEQTTKIEFSTTEPVKEIQTETGIRHTKEEWVKTLEKEPLVTKAPLQKEEVEKVSAVEIAQVSKEGCRYTRQKLSPIRKAIAKRLMDVQQQTAMLTTFNEVDLTHVIALRERYKDEFMKKHNVKLGFMSFFVKAAAGALQAFSEVNSFIDGDDLVTRNFIDISIAVSSERGLFVPVLRDADTLSYADIEHKIDDFAKRAKTGQLKANELQGGSFTITNGGVFGSLLSTPILNPPQCAILGMHKIEKRAVVINDEIVIRSMMYLALSYDHRILDGKEAISFLVHIKNHLEDPERDLLGI
jgi:2-oxoglutarate dehydrogenase E2 component (dihydrolipoamide succinyltransferase)